MIDPIHIARDNILAPVGLENKDIDRLLGRLKSSSIDAGDIYFQSNRLQSWVLEDGIIKEGNFSIEQGAGVRAISGEKTGFAYSDELQLPALLQATEAARAIARGGAEMQIRVSGMPVGRRLYEPSNPLVSLRDEEKIALLHRVDRIARDQDPRVKQVITSLVAAQDVVLVVADDGTLTADVRPLVRLSSRSSPRTASDASKVPAAGGPVPIWDTFWSRIASRRTPGRRSASPWSIWTPSRLPQGP